ncbi:MAG: (d)CMP kinase [Myxococcota bacterium]
MIIAIDGPAGAGKSTIAQRVALELGMQLIDTGAMFRAVAHRALARGVALHEDDALSAIAADMEFAFTWRGDVNVVWCDGVELGDELRAPQVSQAASKVSTVPGVRQALLTAQRAIGRARDSVLEGRDVGTVVFPDAELKIFLTADPAERARRRTEQLRAKGDDSVTYEHTLAQLRERDERDSKRAHAPLLRAHDAIAVDSTSMPIDEVIALILERARLARGPQGAQ